MEERDKLKLVIASGAEVRHDLCRNRKWIVGLFGITILYVLLSSVVIRFFESQWTYLHACYFTVINTTTVGFGDVIPLSHEGKVVAGFNSFVGLILFGLLVTLFALAWQPTGWSTTLTASHGESSEEKNEHTPVRHSEDEGVERIVAEQLEGLAALIRAVNKNEINVLRERKVQIQIRDCSPIRSSFDVCIHVNVGKPNYPLKEPF